MGDGVVCVINTTLPAYQPNVYLCNATSTCCVNRGNPACCQQDVSAGQMFHQLIPILILFGVCWIVVALIHWYFQDDDVAVEKIYSSFTITRTAINFAVPTETDSNVEDPVYGQLYESRIPKFAAASSSSPSSPRQRFETTTPSQRLRNVAAFRSSISRE